MIRDNLVCFFMDAADRHRKQIALIDDGQEYFPEILPEHFQCERKTVM